MTHPRYTSEEIAQRGQVLYEQQIRAQVETSRPGEFLVVDIETGEYEIDADEVAALQRAKTKHPDGSPLPAARWLYNGIQARGKASGGAPMITGMVTAASEAVIRVLIPP